MPLGFIIPPQPEPAHDDDLFWEHGRGKAACYHPRRDCHVKVTRVGEDAPAESDNDRLLQERYKIRIKCGHNFEMFYLCPEKALECIQLLLR